MPKKILFFCGGAYVSGMEIVTLHLMKGLKENGYDIRCIFSGWNDDVFKKKLDEINVPSYEVKIGWIYIRKPLWTLDTLINYPKAFYRCKKILKDYNPDICQFCNFSMSVMLYRLIKPNSVYSIHESYLPNLKNKRIFKLLNKKIKYFTAVSGHIVKVISELGVPGEKIKLIYNGIPIVRRPNPLPPDISVIDRPLHFAIIGQLTAWKGHFVLVNAVKKLVEKRFTQFKIFIYGNDNTDFGTEVKNVIKASQLEDFFIWKGFVNNQEAIYNNCDVVVVPSLSQEPCSMTIIESMANSKALIVSDRGGNPELVVDRVNGMIFNADDPVQLSVCMEELLVNREQIKNYGDAGKARADFHYTYLKMTEKYMELYKEL